MEIMARLLQHKQLRNNTYNPGTKYALHRVIEINRRAFNPYLVQMVTTISFIIS